jgi:AcrR family transcriptional regulator
MESGSKQRTEMAAETRAKLIDAGRKAFGCLGYAEASMDDFTAAAGLTRGALYHHFGDKKGLLSAVIAQIDAEMSERLAVVSGKAENRWLGFVDECAAYIQMAQEPEIQRIVHRDGPCVLGDPSQWPTQNACILGMTSSLEALQQQGAISGVDPEATARLITGALLHAALWIANADDPAQASERAVAALVVLLEGLLDPNAGAPQSEPGAIS